MTAFNEKKTVLVTGASGYIASWVIKYLIEEGHTVHGTVRDKSNQGKVAHLLELDKKGPGTLKLFNADLLEDGSFNEATQGCDIAIHTASPFVVQGIKDPQKELVDPAKKGTKNVLDAVNKTDSVKRVVLTSSVAAIYSDNSDAAKVKNGVFTESDWNTTSSLTHNAYSYSKTVAEKLAWEMANAQDRWSFTTINPSFVMGPSLASKSNSGSLSVMKQMGDGSLKTGAPEMIFGMVDVRDVAKAHLKAAFNTEASGRHIMSAEVKSFLDVAEDLRPKFGDKYPLPKSTLPKFLLYLFGPFMGFSWKYISNNVGIPVQFDNSYAQKDLGIAFSPVNQAIVEMFQQMIDQGILPKK